MNYKVKLSSKNQITLPVDLLRNIEVSKGDILTISFKNSQMIIESMSNIKNKALQHLSDMNPYSIDTKKVDRSYKDLAISRYEKYLKSIKKQKYAS